ncbi:7-cyano-7-deazaguanine synthase, partial [Bacillus cereus]|uniref:7-cyano-7-deazaguanine synthase n=1 Tax=Bacillus cereus TaxID=1396 RepID=UPI002846AFB7
MKKEKEVVVYSGGQDSTTWLFWAIEKFAAVEAVTFNYNRRYKLKIDCAAKISKELGIKNTVLDMSLLSQL